MVEQLLGKGPVVPKATLHTTFSFSESLLCAVVGILHDPTPTPTPFILHTLSQCHLLKGNLPPNPHQVLTLAGLPEGGDISLKAMFFIYPSIHPFNNLCAQHGARSHNPKIKSDMLFQLSQPGPPVLYLYRFILRV